MQKKTVRLALAALLFLTGLASAADAVKAGKSKAPAKAKIERPALGDAFITGSVLFVSLSQPASLSLFNARGEQLFHLDQARGAESIPLVGVNAGFLYLTLRSGSVELTKKLVFTGK